MYIIWVWQAKALEKAREHGFYLGMDWKWLESG